MTPLTNVEIKIFIYLSTDLYMIPNLKKMTNSEDDILTISIGYMEFESQFYGLG